MGVSIKIIKLTMQIGQADLERKLKQAQEFLASGEQVQIQVFLKGRQRSRKESAVNFLNDLSHTWLDSYGKRANEPSTERLSVTYNPKRS